MSKKISKCILNLNLIRINYLKASKIYYNYMCTLSNTSSFPLVPKYTIVEVYLIDVKN